MGYDRPQPSTAAAIPAAAVVPRRSHLVQVIITLSWMVGITASFLTVGVIGMFAADLPPIHLKSLEDLDQAEEIPMVETSMAELLSMAETSTEQSADAEPVLPVEIPDTVETPPENLDLPEIAEAMTMEDVFAVPTAPKIEDALRPVDPEVKPRPAPTPQRTRTAAVASSSGTRSSTSQAGTAGGTGTAGSGGKGKFPQPGYPDFARSAGMQGTVRLSISVGPSGMVEGVTVVGSTGFSSLDEYAASWVRRNWQWPGGAAHRYTLPLTFRLR
ncbi:energy transducer TonB [Prosthecobacter sp.]|uniref:energy transducer TonB n=1 Tax=Prosthecobacter sp. TaxID=1965333 RepID=UPI0037832027